MGQSAHCFRSHICLVSEYRFIDRRWWLAELEQLEELVAGWQYKQSSLLIHHYDSNLLLLITAASLRLFNQCSAARISVCI